MSEGFGKRGFPKVLDGAASHERQKVKGLFNTNPRKEQHMPKAPVKTAMAPRPPKFENMSGGKKGTKGGGKKC